MPKVKAVSPFYDEKRCAPPPFPSMLTDQLELFGDTMPHSSSLLADEVLPRMRSVSPERSFESKLGLPQQHHFELKPGLATTSKPGRTARSPHPVAEKIRQPSRAVSEESLSELSSASDTTSDGGSSSSALSEDPKIPKPAGEPGRPGRGGYNLEATLNWNHRAYSKFKTQMHKLIKQHLDTTKCASSQDHALLKLVHNKARTAFPDLENYQDCWPVSDIIMMRLKYTSSRARRHESGPVIAEKAPKRSSSNKKK